MDLQGILTLSAIVVMTLLALVIAVLSARKPPAIRDEALKPSGPKFSVAAGGSRDSRGYNTATVGESNYQPALRAIAGKRTGYVTLHLSAKLVLENDNPLDPNAVLVTIHGKTVGYLSRTKAIVYRASMPPKIATCRAKVCGGGASRPSYGVWLDL